MDGELRQHAYNIKGNLPIMKTAEYFETYMEIISWERPNTNAGENALKMAKWL